MLKYWFIANAGAVLIEGQSFLAPAAPSTNIDEDRRRMDDKSTSKTTKRSSFKGAIY